MPVVRLGDQGDHRGAAVAERGDLRVVGGDGAGPAGGAERRQLRVLEVELGGGAAEELGVLRVRARPAALDVAHAEPVELPGDRELVGDREVEPLLLGAVAQGGVVDVERAVQVHRGLSRSRGFGASASFLEQQKNLSEYERWARRRVDALLNDDLAGGWAMVVTSSILPRSETAVRWSVR